MSQEIWNGLSMAVPVAVLSARAPHTIYGMTAVAGTTVHACVSCGYHLYCAYDPTIDPANCLGRKLDQTFIHISAAMVSYSTSHSWHYAAFAASLNTNFIWGLWLPTDTSFARRTRIFVSYLIIVCPILLKDAYLGMHTACILLLSLSAFFLKTKWEMGHTLFHVGLGFFCNDLAKAI